MKKTSLSSSQKSNYCCLWEPEKGLRCGSMAIGLARTKASILSTDGKTEKYNLVFNVKT